MSQINPHHHHHHQHPPIPSCFLSVKSPPSLDPSTLCSPPPSPPPVSPSFPPSPLFFFSPLSLPLCHCHPPPPPTHPPPPSNDEAPHKDGDGDKKTTAHKHKQVKLIPWKMSQFRVVVVVVMGGGMKQTGAIKLLILPLFFLFSYQARSLPFSSCGRRGGGGGEPVADTGERATS